MPPSPTFLRFDLVPLVLDLCNYICDVAHRLINVMTYICDNCNQNSSNRYDIRTDRQTDRKGPPKVRLLGYNKRPFDEMKTKRTRKHSKQKILSK